MKEKILIPKEHIEYEQISGAGFDTIRFHLGTDKIEKVPENWEELLELCKTLKKVNVCKNGYCIEFNDLRFYMDGTIIYGLGNETEGIVKICVTASRMWQIIKNLVGEE